MRLAGPILPLPELERERQCPAVARRNHTSHQDYSSFRERISQYDSRRSRRYQSANQDSSNATLFHPQSSFRSTSIPCPTDRIKQIPFITVTAWWPYSITFSFCAPFAFNIRRAKLARILWERWAVLSSSRKRHGRLRRYKPVASDALQSFCGARSIERDSFESTAALAAHAEEIGDFPSGSRSSYVQRRTDDTLPVAWPSRSATASRTTTSPELATRGRINRHGEKCKSFCRCSKSRSARSCVAKEELMTSRVMGRV